MWVAYAAVAEATASFIGAVDIGSPRLTTRCPMVATVLTRIIIPPRGRPFFILVLFFFLFLFLFFLFFIIKE
jgi:hypothetical protein